MGSKRPTGPATDHPPRSGTIRVGVAGWDYPDWAGTVYPAGAARGFDRLAWIARWVDLIEINSTFYRPVTPRVAEGWVRRTRDRANFRFTAKSHRSWTHDPDADLAVAVPETLEGLAPLRDAGRLGCVLIQFPQSFHRNPATIERLERLLDRVGDWRVAVEVRHVSWRDERTIDLLRNHEASFCLVDQPKVGSTTLEALDWVTSAAVAYARLHGRNARNWFRADAGRDARYDYRYSLEQLAPIAEQVEGMAEQAAEVFVVQNNHFRGQALANALQVRHLLDGATPEAPEELVATYPDLESSVFVRRTRLF